MSHLKLRFYYHLIVGVDTLLISTTFNLDHEVEALLLHLTNHGKSFSPTGDATVAEGIT